MHASFDAAAEAHRVLSAPKSPHSQLGVRSGASFAEIKSRYRELCSLHPDKCKLESAGAAFAVVSAAYCTLQATHTQPASNEPLRSSQPEATQGSRWQAFTGQPKQQPVWQPQQQEQPFASGGAPSQENRTPPAADSGGGSAWQTSKWGQYGSSTVLRAQPMTAAPVRPAGSTHLREVPSSLIQRHDSPRSRGCSSSDDSWSDGIDEGAPGGSCRWHGGSTVLPAAFYDTGGTAGTRHSPRAAQPAPASLYGMFGRHSSSDLGSWQGGTHQPVQPSHAGVVHPTVRQQHVAPLAAPQPAAAQGGSRWSSKSSQLAELLRKPLVGVPQTASTAARSSLGGQHGWEQAKGDVSPSGSSSSSDGNEAGISDAVPEPGVHEGRASLQQAAARQVARSIGNGIIKRGKGRALQRYRKKRQASSGKGSGKRQAKLKLMSVKH